MNSFFISEPSSDADQLATRRLAELLIPQRDPFITDLFRTTIEGVPELAGDDMQRALVYSSIAENTIALIAALRNGIDTSSVVPPPGALALATELARRGTSLASLLRAYRIGQARFTAMCVKTAKDGIEDLTVLPNVVGKVAAFIDHVCEEVTRNYESEREVWISSRTGITQHWIGRLLTGKVDDLAEAEAALRYPLGVHHVAICTWYPPRKHTACNILTDSQKMLEAVAASLPRLLVPAGAHAATSWVAFKTPNTPLLSRIRTLSLPDGLRVATGLPGMGASGFRRTHQQAHRAMAMSKTAWPPAPTVLDYDTIAPVAMLSDDHETLRQFVADILKDLAQDNPRAAELRETVRVYLHNHHSMAAAAEALVVHRNTIRYRLQQVADELGNAIEGTDPYLLTSALEICRWYGPAVLTNGQRQTESPRSENRH